MSTQLINLIKNGATIIDVRTPGEFAEGCNPKSINIPLDVFPQKLATLAPDRNYVLCCASGGRSQMAASLMKGGGFKVVVNAGPWQNTLV